MWRVVLVSLACVAACSTTKFVQTDASFKPHATKKTVEVFVASRPSRPYRIVGTIKVKWKDGYSVDEAVRKAREVGCDFLVYARAERYEGRNSGERGILIAQQPGSHGWTGGTIGEDETDVGPTFHCGVYLDASASRGSLPTRREAHVVL